MGKKKQIILENIRLMKLVHGGQCIGQNEHGKAVFVWGGLPGELVDIRVTKKKSSYLEGIVTQVHEASDDRIEPVEPLSYLSTSPWQIMTIDAENAAKHSILTEAFEREGVEDLLFEPFVASASGRTVRVDGFIPAPGTIRNPEGVSYMGYRNKNEFGFWGADDGLHLAHYVRGTNGKQMVTESKLAHESINQAARDVRDELNRLDVWAGKLKTVLIRSSQAGEAVAALFIKEEINMSDFTLPNSLKGIDVYYSDPQSPASVPTKKLYSLGDITLSDTINGKEISYDVMSFFQVNIPIFEQALGQIKAHSSGTSRVVDMYSGVGAIGIAVGADVLIDSDDANIAMAKQNVTGTDTTVVHATAETALDHIKSGDTLIVDPPRAGLHKDVVQRILDIQPSKIIYLSCNPSTQARDVKLLLEKYKVVHAQGFNFFPRTPHIESLFILELK